MMSRTPAQLGYRMPAEWEPHEATWIAWPHNKEDWPGKFAPVPWVYTEIVRHLSRVETVFIVVSGGKMERDVRDHLDLAGVGLDRVRFFRARTDRVWLRDSGPTFVIRDGADVEPGPGAEATSPALVGWRFNAWAKYENYHKDQKIPRRIAEEFGLRLWKPNAEIDGKPVRVVLEGGSIDVNGKGSLLTTEECLLSDIQCRNPGLDRAGYEKLLAEYLGVSNVIWLGRGIFGDDTHGHVDDLARFKIRNTVVTVVEPREDDLNHEP
ncbi:MAG: agmatine deiminase family protein [Isosphaeraceae bacterium]